MVEVAWRSGSDMGDFDAWGPAQSGVRLQEQDAQDALMRAAQVRGLQASARENNAQAAGREQELEGQKKLAAMMSQMGQSGQPSAGGSLAEPLEQMARASFASGLVSQGGKLASEVALVRAREATAGNAQASQARQQLESRAKMLEHAGGLYADADSQEGLDRANALYAHVFQRPSPVAGQEYSPELVQQLQQFGSTSLARTREELARVDAEGKAANRESAIKFRDFRKGVLREELTLKKDREARLGKVGGGKGIATPSTTERKLAENLIGEEFPDLAERKGELGPAAFAVASRAKALQQNNRALDADTAMRQAFAEEKAAGNFAQVDEAYRTLGFPRKGTKHSKPEALPADRKLVAGKRYVTPKGVIMWDGQRGVPVKPGAAVSTLPSALPDDEDPLDEEGE